MTAGQVQTRLVDDTDLMARRCQAAVDLCGNAALAAARQSTNDDQGHMLATKCLLHCERTNAWCRLQQPQSSAAQLHLQPHAPGLRQALPECRTGVCSSDCSIAILLLVYCPVAAMELHSCHTGLQNRSVAHASCSSRVTPVVTRHRAQQRAQSRSQQQCCRALNSRSQLWTPDQPEDVFEEEEDFADDMEVPSGYQGLSREQIGLMGLQPGLKRLGKEPDPVSTRAQVEGSCLNARSASPARCNLCISRHLHMCTLSALRCTALCLEGLHRQRLSCCQPSHQCCLWAMPAARLFAGNIIRTNTSKE